MSQEYDKIVKENLRGLLVPLLRATTGLEIVKSESLPTALNYTLEREADFVQRVTTRQGERFILHLEFQTKNDPRMLERMLLYHALLYQVYRTEVRQCVFYLGKGKMNMPNRLETNHVQYDYELVNLKTFPYETFLASDAPEEVILAILGDLSKVENRTAVRQIFAKLSALLPHSDLLFQQRVRQLEKLSLLRDLRDLILKEESTMALVVDITRDKLYKKGEQRGERRGEQRAKHEVALELLKRGMDLTAVAEITGLSVSTLEELRKQLGQ